MKNIKDKNDKQPFNPRQMQFISGAQAKYNLAHGAIRSGKTVCTLFCFMKRAFETAGSSIFIIGYSLSTIYQNIIQLLFESEELKFFAPYCNWSPGSHVLMFGSKKIKCIGAGDEGALGIIQGLTIDLCYCDEMTLYPDNVIYMIDSRLSREHSRLYASMNPKQPDHPLKQWVDEWEVHKNPLYYALHFTIDDNAMFLPEGYRENLKKRLSGLFYKRNYLGLWCMAEGAIFDHFDRNLHVKHLPPLGGTDYYIAGIDYGTSVCFACVLVGVSTGIRTQTGKRLWVEKEYYWSVEQTKRQKTNSEYLRDIQAFLGDYPVKAVYLDPAAAAFSLELRRAGIHVSETDNEVLDGIQKVSQLLGEGTLTILDCCTNLIREIEGYVWDTKKVANKGVDAPIKKNDHAVDALRYAIASHIVPKHDAGDGRTLGGGGFKKI